MIVVENVFTHDFFKEIFTKEDEMIGAFMFDGSDDSFTVSVHPGRMGCGTFVFYMEMLTHLVKPFFDNTVQQSVRMTFCVHGSLADLQSLLYIPASNHASAKTHFVCNEGISHTICFE